MEAAAFSATVPPLTRLAPQGGTQQFSHHILSSIGVEVPPATREHAWRFSYFNDYCGTTSHKRLDDVVASLSEDEKKRRAEAAERAWKTFVENEAPKRMAALRSASKTDPVTERGKTLDQVEPFVLYENNNEIIYFLNANNRNFIFYFVLRFFFIYLGFIFQFLISFEI